ncbi:MAG: DUF4192 domain-containing protein [Mycobacteriales bacterium]|nr:DUF4192 domain-containing protein [Mycobacteriales bacterium]
MTRSDSPPVLRLTDPGSIAAAVPVIAGYRPTQSLVVMSLRPPRKRLGLTMRADLEACVEDDGFVDYAVDAILRDGAMAAVLVVFSEDGAVDEELPWRDLVTATADALAAGGVDVMEQLCVRRDRWFSYSCLRSCCPLEGTPLPQGTSPLEAQAVLEGKVVLPDREALAATLVGAPPGSLVARLRAERLTALTEELIEEPPAAWEQRCVQVVASFRTMLAGLAPGAHPQVVPEDDVVLPVLAALVDRDLRDAVLATITDEELPVAIELLAALVRSSVPPWTVAPATMLAWCAWRRGGGALANLAAELALRIDPTCRLAAQVSLAMRYAVRPGPQLGVGATGPTGGLARRRDRRDAQRRADRGQRRAG